MSPEQVRAGRSTIAPTSLPSARSFTRCSRASGIQGRFPRRDDERDPQGGAAELSTSGREISPALDGSFVTVWRSLPRPVSIPPATLRSIWSSLHRGQQIIWSSGQSGPKRGSEDRVANGRPSRARARASGGVFLGSRARRSDSPRFRAFTFRRGTIRSARFAPDGHTIVYGAAWQGAPIRLFSASADHLESAPVALSGFRHLRDQCGRADAHLPRQAIPDHASRHRHSRQRARLGGAPTKSSKTSRRRTSARMGRASPSSATSRERTPRIPLGPSSARPSAG